MLADRPALDRPAPSPLGRAGRWVRALHPGIREARALASCDDGRLFVAGDVFRIAQVYFDIHRKPLRVRLPGPPGIMHWTFPVPLTAVGWRNFYTVHDVIPLLYPGLTHINPHRYRRLLARLSESGGQFITVSPPARDDILTALGWAGDRVIDCGLAVESDPPPEGELPAGLTPRGYLLICGTVERRKNIVRALRAYRAAEVTLPIVIAGPDGWHADEVAAEMAETPAAVRLPYLDRTTVRMLMAQARALLMPSLAEGFGLPIAEAMALGTPVGTANRGALADTAGGAAVTFDPADENAMAQSIRRLANDDALAEELRTRGFRNAQRFTPERFAARLAYAYGLAVGHAG
jgi:glycosyltransferase involved in cell wall biosynthesis